MSSIRLALATLALAAAVGAQSHPVLTINGEAHASVPLNRTMDIHLVANAGSTAFGLFNIDPGPTPFLNTTIPISIGPNLLIGFQSFVMPPSGDHHFTLPIAQNAALEGVKVYAFVLTFDNALPQGFGLSNGADFVLVREPSAGPDTIALTGHGVTLDGSSNHAATLPAGQTLQWSVTNGPVGHAATLGGANTEFPTLNADLPGLYDVELSLLAPGSTGGATDTVQIEVFELQSLSHQHGDFDLADPIAFSANLAGPPASAFELVGIASGTTSVSGNVAAGNPVTDLLLKVQGANGQTIRRPVTIVNNVGASMVTPPLDSFAAYLGQPIIDEVEMLLETALSAVNLSGPLTGIPSIPVATIPGPFGTTLFSADVTPTSFSYDPMVLVDLTLNAGSAHGQITLNNVAFGFDISGLLFNAAYMDMGTLASTSVVIDFDFALSVVNGAWVTTVSNETAMVNGATLTFVGGIIPAAFTSGLAGTIVPLIEPLFAT
ncbi:MAG: hypothetical protein KDB53_20665, partial [Planctomycetes bacterium]|nr:hypothetical protein [Planctomycetota bacterium]